MAQAEPAEELTYTETKTVLRTVAVVDESFLKELDPALQKLSYPQMKALQALCQLKEIPRQALSSAVSQLAGIAVQMDHLVLLDYFTGLPGNTLTGSMDLLLAVAHRSSMEGRVLASLAHLPKNRPAQVLAWINQVFSLRESGQWAAKQFFELKHHQGTSVEKGLALLATMNEQQQRAAESLCAIPQLAAEESLSLLQKIQTLPEASARVARVLFSLPDMTSAEALFWLSEYLPLDVASQDKLFIQLSASRKMILLAAFSGSSQDFLWKINNLHDITDDLGQEISGRTLATMGVENLSRLFKRLDVTTQNRFQQEMDAARAKGSSAIISLLRQATPQARRQAALDLTSAHIYILLARGNELYDSSFRDILSPVLLNRISANFSGDLLSFLTATDPQSAYTGDFIANLAQKGKLLTFWPQDAFRQKQILTMVTSSAFNNQSSLLLFSATFARLLENLHPEARSFLLQQMLERMNSSNDPLTRQLRVILQYYLDNRPALLSSSEQGQISSLLSKKGRIDVSPYISTPFARWKEDGKLTSLSIFQQDDDGRQSFLANCAHLLESGYRPTFSQSYENSDEPEIHQQLTTFFALPPSRQNQTLSHLYQLVEKSGTVIDWQKTVNGIRILHSTAVYQGEDQQKYLLEEFIKGDHEMFAQRGHSYWRQEQLINPLKALLKEGKITKADLTAMPRFLSIGSCGGIRVYAELNQLFFNSVDILATVGTGKTSINNPYNQQFLEIIAQKGTFVTWQEVVNSSADIFAKNLGDDYLQPGSLPAILHKMIDSTSDDTHQTH